MRSDKLKIFDWFYRIDSDGQSLDFELALADAAEGALGKDRIDAEAFAVQGKKLYWNYLLQHIDNERKRRLVPLLNIINAGDFKVSLGTRKASADTGKRQKKQLTLVGARPLLVRKIDLLTDRQYEALGALACRALGKGRVRLTPKGNEGGIDFIAAVKLTNKRHPFWGRSGSLRILGQCKKYRNSVEIGKIREFVESIAVVQRKGHEVRNTIPVWFYETPGPIVGWFISHSGFQSGAAGKAKDHGILTSDTIDIAEILALSRILNTSRAPDQRAEEMIRKIRRVLSMPARWE